MAQTVARVQSIVEQGAFAQQVSINAAKLATLKQDIELREVVNCCELVNADGQSVVWASRLLGDPLPERVAGIDLMHALIAMAARRAMASTSLAPAKRSWRARCKSCARCIRT